VQNTQLELGDTVQPFGTLLSEYDVAEYWDLRSSQEGQAPRRAYIVSLRQRLTLANSSATDFTGLQTSPVYTYPILAVNSVVPSSSVQNLDFYLEDYSPKTLNASVTASQNQGTNSTDASSVQHSQGSSTSVTNTFEVSASAGFFGMDPTGSVSTGFSTSDTTSTQQSTSREREQARGVQSGSGSSMSVKDWASYGFIDAQKKNVSWAWGQEYPWNIIDFRGQGSPDGSSGVELPCYVQKLLWDGTFLYPPSQIAQFGLNFVAHAKWVCYVDGAAGAADETLSFQHTLTYWKASHSYDGSSLKAVVQPLANDHEVETLTLNLPVLSLEPISSDGPGNGAVVGFVRSEFITATDDQGTPFRLKSNANNLYISNGKGFQPLSDDNAILTAPSITASSPAAFTLQFKITDPEIELSLHLKHWKTTPESCTLTIDVNGQVIIRHVDAMNAASGADNITSIALRALDYTSADYYDYLVMGTNTVTVTVAPGDGAQACNYALRALALQ
jgi:hypothetical protein